MHATNMQPIQVLLIYDHRLILGGLETLLGHETDITVIGVAGTATEALAMAERTPPDVIVMDEGPPPGTNGLDLLSDLHTAVPESHVIVLSARNDPDLHWRAVLLGASGVVLTEKTVSQLVQAIRVVYAGGVWLDRAVLTRLPVPTDDLAVKIRTLTPHEREVGTLVAQGLRNREIAERLRISEAIVRSHLTAIYAKLGVTSRVEVLRVYARFSKLTPAEVAAMDPSSSQESEYTAPLSLYFDLDEVTPTEVAKIIQELSECYQALGGDKLVIEEVTILDSSEILDPVGA